MVGLLSGNIDVLVLSTPSVLSQVKGKQIRLLAISGKQRAAALPDVPTFAEGGVPGQGHKPPRVAVPHVDAQHGRHPKPRRAPHKIPVGRRRPYVRQGHARHARRLRPR